MSVKKVTRRGKSVWRARCIINGHTAVKYCSRKDEAIEAETEMRARLKLKAQSQDSPLARWGGKVPTLAQYEEVLMESSRAAGNGPAEIKHKQQHMRDHLLPEFGKLRLDQISTDLITTFVDAKLLTLSGTTVVKLLATLRRALTLAVDAGVIAKVPKITKPKLGKADFDFLDFDEADRFLAAAGEQWWLFLFTAIRTGLRQGELRGLQWGDVDLRNRRIRVARAFTQSGWGEPKSGHGRTVDLAHDVVEALERLKPAKASRTALVFPGPSGAPLDEKAIYKACVAASEGAGIGRVISPHKLRHTFASHHAMRGTPMPVLQAWLGHADLTTTMRYSHLAPSARASFADAIAPSRGPRLVVDPTPREARGGPTGGPTKNGAPKNAV